MLDSRKNCRNVPSVEASRARIPDARRQFTDTPFEISACHDRLIIPRRYRENIRYTRTHRASYPRAFSTILDKKWVSRFVYANPAASERARARASRQTRAGQRSSEISQFRLPAGQPISAKNVCSAVAMRRSRIGPRGFRGDDYKRRCARTMLGRQLPHLHRPRVETSRCPRARKSISLPSS